MTEELRATSGTLYQRKTGTNSHDYVLKLRTYFAKSKYGIFRGVLATFTDLHSRGLGF